MKYRATQDEPRDGPPVVASRHVNGIRQDEQDMTLRVGNTVNGTVYEPSRRRRPTITCGLRNQNPPYPQMSEAIIGGALITRRNLLGDPSKLTSAANRIIPQGPATGVALL